MVFEQSPLRKQEYGPYQNYPRRGAAPLLRRSLALLALLTAACAPVDAQQRGSVDAAPGAGPLTSGAATASLAPSAPLPLAAPAAAAPPSMAQQAVVAAREAMLRKQWSALALAVPQASGDVLGMYPEYWLLRYQVATLPSGQRPAAQLQSFLSRHGDAFLGDRLRNDWLLAAARSGDFTTVKRLAPVKTGSGQTACAVLNAHHMTGRKATAQQAVDAFAPGAWCWTLYDQLVADHILGWRELEPQLRDAIEANRTNDARKFAAYLLDPAQLKAYDALIKDPMQWLVRQGPATDRVQTELVTIALARLARKDLDVGDAYVRREWAGRLPKENLAWVRAQYALVAVLNQDSRAAAWYAEAGPIRLTDYNAAWRVRAALRAARIDWTAVIAAIDAMTKDQREESTWIYWHARAQAALGHKERAAQEFASIAHGFDFYGQLAAEELGRPIHVPPRAAPVTAQELAQAQADPGLRRAIALFRLGWRAEAVPEWNFAIRTMNDRQLLAAAELARSENIYDRVVNTSERTEKQFDFTQRYIAPFEGRVSAKAREIALDPAWVYGLIRQESRFIMDARSSAGASGLMQLMPGTAKWVAGKIGMTDFHPGSVNDFDTNTILGTNYLNMVLRDLGGSQVLASAGYNAGPRRPQRWRAALSQPVEGAIFAETIPFTETRTYVKNVMANATYYAAMFSGRPQSLKQRLGEIAPQGATSSDLP